MLLKHPFARRPSAGLFFCQLMLPRWMRPRGLDSQSSKLLKQSNFRTARQRLLHSLYCWPIGLHICFRGIVRHLARVILNGEVGGPANRLGARELALLHCVGASCFCLRLCWDSPLLRTRGPRLDIDDASVRHGIHVLDLLSTPSALADLG